MRGGPSRHVTGGRNPSSAHGGGVLMTGLLAWRATPLADDRDRRRRARAAGGGLEHRCAPRHRDVGDSVRAGRTACATGRTSAESAESVTRVGRCLHPTARPPCSSPPPPSGLARQRAVPVERGLNLPAAAVAPVSGLDRGVNDAAGGVSQPGGSCCRGRCRSCDAAHRRSRPEATLPARRPGRAALRSGQLARAYHGEPQETLGGAVGPVPVSGLRTMDQVIGPRGAMP